MRSLSLKSLGVSLAVSGLVLLGVATPATAADSPPFTNPQISMAGTVPTTGATTEQLVVTVTTATSGATSVQIQGMSWTLTTPVSQPTCPAGLVVTGMVAPLTCISFAAGGSNDQVIKISSGTAIPAGTTVTITMPAGLWTAAATPMFYVTSTYLSGFQDAIVNSSVLSLAPAPTPDPDPAPAPTPTPADDPTLAMTGAAETTALVGAGALALVAGVVAFTATSRRRRAQV